MPEPTAQFLIRITKKAGAATARLFGKAKIAYTKKNVNDIVTEADLESEKILVSAIKKKYPSHKIISEEGNTERQVSEHVWIIDPLDGTRNFSTSVPLYGVMVGYMHNGKMQLAAIHIPITGDLFFAERGKGAFHNGKRVRCSKKAEFKNSYGCDDSFGKVAVRFKIRLESYPGLDGWYTRLNAVGVSAGYVASGQRDWMVFSGSKGIWDYAMPALLLKEAGCLVTNYKGKEWTPKDRELVAGNKHLHPVLLKLIRK